MDNHRTPNVPRAFLTNAYDIQGRRTSLAPTVNDVADFTNSCLYHNLDRMTRVSQPRTGVAAKRVDFAYHLDGQLQTVERYIDDESISRSPHDDDSAGRLLGIDQLLWFDERYYTWDYRNRLTDLTYKTSGDVVTKRVKYIDHVNDRRLSKQIDASPVDGVHETIERDIYDGDDIVLVYNQNNALANRYLQGPGVDQVLAEENAAGAVTWLLADRLDSIRDESARDTFGGFIPDRCDRCVLETHGRWP